MDQSEIQQPKGFSSIDSKDLLLTKMSRTFSSHTSFDSNSKNYEIETIGDPDVNRDTQQSIPMPGSVLSDDSFDIEMRDPEIESFNRVPLFPEDRQEISCFMPKPQHIFKEPVHQQEMNARRDIPLLKSSSTMNEEHTDLVCESSMRQVTSWFSDNDYDEYDKENQYANRDEVFSSPRESSVANPPTELSLHLSPAFSEGEPEMEPVSNSEQCI